eukprot:4256331-Prymnesium_polylepis.1
MCIRDRRHGRRAECAQQPHRLHGRNAAQAARAQGGAPHVAAQAVRPRPRGGGAGRPCRARVIRARRPEWLRREPSARVVEA